MRFTRDMLLGCGLALLVAGCGRAGPADSAPEGAAQPPPLEVKASVDKAVATTGDVITYTVTVEHDPGIEIDVPEPGAEIAGFRIIEVGKDEPRRARGRVVEKRWYQLRADLVGSYVLPPVTVTYRVPQEAGGDEEAAAKKEQTARTSEIFVEVESVLPQDGEAKDIRGLKPLHPVAASRRWWWIGGGVALALLLAAGGGWWWWRRRERPEAPPIPAHERAFQELEALRAVELADMDAVRRFYFGLSEVVRRYVEGRFGLNATDLTSEEIVPRLEGLRGLEPQPRETLRSFLADTDQVKFAGHVPGEGEIETAWERALGFVEATRERSKEPEEPAEKAA